jgi:hypothetical protein
MKPTVRLAILLMPPNFVVMNKKRERETRELSEMSETREKP